ncbi:AflYd/sugR/sugar regulator [Colletotrichum acutatum]
MEKGKKRTNYPCDGCSLRRIRQNRSGLPLPARGPTQSPRSPSTPGVENESTAQQNPLEVYIEYLDKFRDHLTCVWPIVNVESLKSRISGSPNDHDAWALAGAVCATVIAQLRLSQLRLSKQHNLASDDNSIAESFAHHAQLSHNLSNQHHQSTYYKEDTTVTHQASHGILTRGNFSITFAKPAPPRDPGQPRRGPTRIAVADLLVGVRNRETFPLSGFHIQGVGEVDASFQLLAQLFALLDDNIVMAADRGGVTPDSSNADNLYSALSAMAKQDFSALAPNLPETQRVNVLMTGNWIHILWWQFALSHYQMSSRMDDTMLSMLKPAKVAHETMRLLGSVSQQAIRTHGYGLKALLLIGGPESLFHKKLMLVMAESQLPVPNVKNLTPCEEEEYVEDS